MLLNFSRLGMKNEAKELSDSLNGYLNIYKSLMMSSLKSIDYFNTVKSNKNCNETGCTVQKKMKKANRDLFYWAIWLILVIVWNYGYPIATPFQDVLVAVLLSIIFILIKKRK